MINVILQKPILYFYGKANSGKTASLLKMADVFAPFYKQVHFFSPNRVSYYKSIIKEKNVVVHGVSTSKSLIKSLSSLDKSSLVLIDDVTIITSIEYWNQLWKELEELKFGKTIITLDANPNVLNNNNILPVLRCEQIDGEIVLEYKGDSMSLNDIVKFINRNLTLDNFWQFI